MLKTYFYKLLSFTNNISIKLGAILAGFFSPIQGIIFLCMILAFMDFFIKLYVVYTTEGREAIKSKKMEDTLYKILFYSAAITVIHLVDVIFVKDVGADIAVTSGSTVTITAWVKQDFGGSSTITKLKVLGGYVDGVSEVTDTHGNNTNWENLSVTINPTESGVVPVYVEYSTTTLADTIYIGSITIT